MKILYLSCRTNETEELYSRLQYALSVVKPGGKVFTGGILATLRPEWIAKEFPTVINNTGLLNHEGTLGLKGEECIDTLPLDYGILDDIKDEYKYPAEDAYFTYMTNWKVHTRVPYKRIVCISVRLI